MNRIIKFRAWHKKSKKMFTPVSLLSNYNNGAYDTETKESIYMQFTGLKDKNGKEIYEGDILYWEAEGQVEKWEVKWNEKRSGWFLRGFLPIDVSANCEVMGNVWENGDLLK